MTSESDEFPRDVRTAEFYDRLAADYHALYPDWEQETRTQGEALDRVVGGRDRTATCITDVACGIGTQLVGLAALGYRMRGSDLSREAIARARVECEQRGLSAVLEVADMRRLPWPSSSADHVLCADNALPHLLHEADVVRAVSEMGRVVKAGGSVVISTRDYDRVLQERPSSTPPQIFDDGVQSIISFQTWKWRGDSDIYDLDHFQLRRIDAGNWSAIVRAATYRAYSRDRLAHLAQLAGLRSLAWHMPADTGFFQPLLVGRK